MRQKLFPEPRSFWLTSIPGIGPSRAWFLMAEVDIHDFERAKQLAAYLGVTPHARPATVAAQPG